MAKKSEEKTCCNCKRARLYIDRPIAANVECIDKRKDPMFYFQAEAKNKCEFFERREKALWKETR